MCSGSFAKCLGISLLPLALVCLLCNILLFFPGGYVIDDNDHISEEVWYFGGILGSGVLMIFPALVFLGLKNNDCCGCCGNENCGKRFAMLSSMLFALVGAAGAAYSVIVASVGIHRGPQCLTQGNQTDPANGSALVWDYPFTDGDYLTNHTLWSLCVQPEGVVSWNLSLWGVLLAMGLLQVALCAVQVINGMLGALCGDCCGCCGSS